MAFLHPLDGAHHAPIQGAGSWLELRSHRTYIAPAPTPLTPSSYCCHWGRFVVLILTIGVPSPIGRYWGNLYGAGDGPQERHAVLSLDTGGIIFWSKTRWLSTRGCRWLCALGSSGGRRGTTEYGWYAQAQVGDSTLPSKAINKNGMSFPISVSAIPQTVGDDFSRRR